jgi:hypothetical protein
MTSKHENGECLTCSGGAQRSAEATYPSLNDAWGELLASIAVDIPNNVKTKRFYEALNDMAGSIAEATAHDGRRSAEATNQNETKGQNEMAKKTSERPVIVTTEHRGVFFGYADSTDGEQIALKRARLCVYWSAEVKGFMGLASGGPTEKCRIGPPADIKLRKITAVLEVTPEAEKAWEAAPWNG